MVSLSEFMKEDKKRRKMTLREYAKFIGSTHPTVARYIKGQNKQPQWDFLVNLSRATHTDIGIIARYAAPEVAFERVPNGEIILQRLNQLPPEFRRTILDMIDAYLAQQDSTEDRK